MRFVVGLALFTGLSACEPLGARDAELITVLTRADEALLRTRPLITGAKYARMAELPYSFYRGTFALFLHDVRSGSVSLPQVLADLPVVPSLGDAHFENFGTLLGADGALSFEPNDFDAADLWPAWVDLARLSGSLALAAELSNPDDTVARDLAREALPSALAACAGAYASSLRATASGEPPPVIDAGGDWGPLVADLFERAETDVAHSVAIDLGGYSVADQDPMTLSPKTSEAVVFPAGTSVGPGEYLVIVANLAGAMPGPQTDCLPSGGPATCFQATFGIGGGEGDTLYLLAPGGLVEEQVTLAPDVTASGESYCRFPNGTGDFQVCVSPTPGAANL